jgi:hypothetical protein
VSGRTPLGRGHSTGSKTWRGHELRPRDAQHAAL